MSAVDLDRERLAEALALAHNAIGLSDPNPRVGCIIGDQNGRIFGRGWTQQAGGPHAEVMALRDAQAGGHAIDGATVWVTLEPCAHHGRTPPCCDALLGAGVGRVVVALADPFPQVAGAGIARLRAAGVTVDGAPQDIADQAWALNVGFFSRVLRGRPWVRAKIASSLDGRTALDNGASQWITGPEARKDGHLWRKRAGAVLTGIGTVLADDPRLDVRHVDTTLQPARAVVDSGLRTPPTAQFLAGTGRSWIFTASDDQARGAVLRERGATLIAMNDGQGRVDLQALLAFLAGQGINELHVEAGRLLTGSLLQAGLVDEVVAYVAPLLLGGGRGWVEWAPLSRLDQGIRMALQETRVLGADLMLRLRRADGPDFSLQSAGLLASSGFTSSLPFS